MSVLDDLLVILGPGAEIVDDQAELGPGVRVEIGMPGAGITAATLDGQELTFTLSNGIVLPSVTLPGLTDAEAAELEARVDGAEADAALLGGRVAVLESVPPLDLSDYATLAAVAALDAELATLESRTAALEAAPAPDLSNLATTQALAAGLATKASTAAVGALDTRLDVLEATPPVDLSGLAQQADLDALGTRVDVLEAGGTGGDAAWIVAPGDPTGIPDPGQFYVDSVTGRVYGYSYPDDLPEPFWNPLTTLAPNVSGIGLADDARGLLWFKSDGGFQSLPFSAIQPVAELPLEPDGQPLYLTPGGVYRYVAGAWETVLAFTVGGTGDVTQAELDAVAERVQDLEDAPPVDLSGLATDAELATLEGRVTTAETTLTGKASQASLNALSTSTSTDLGLLNGRLQTAESDLAGRPTAAQITALGNRATATENDLNTMLRIPAGGAAGQVITKLSAAAGDFTWQTPAAGGGTVSPTLTNPIYGTGRGGDVVLGAAGSAFPWNQVVGQVLTMSRDLSCANLTVPVGYTIITNGYRLFVSGTLTNNGTIRHDGTNAVGNTPAAVTAGGSLGTGAGGGNGNNGGWGGTGGSGGTHGPGVGAVGTAGFPAGYLAGADAWDAHTFLLEARTASYNAGVPTYTSIRGGAGGGSGASPAAGGVIGAGGSGGGVMLIAARAFAGSGLIAARGGNGGNASGTGGAGGGGGGGGGFLRLITPSAALVSTGTGTWTLGSMTINLQGGTGGTGVNGGTSGSVGVAGNVELVLV